MEQVLVFDVWGDYAHFRKYYTTSSPLTFSIPPRTAVCGLIAGIIGLDKQEYLKYFTKNRADIAVRILNPVKKVRIAENLIDTKNAPMMGRIKNRTQIRFEFLKDPAYRIYFRHTDTEVYNSARDFLQEGKCVYTPCLGLSEHLASFKFLEEAEFSLQEGDGFVRIDSVVPMPDDSKIELKLEEGEYFQETLPVEMEEDRTVREYCKTVFERNGKPLSVKVESYWEVRRQAGSERIVFL